MRALSRIGARIYGDFLMGSRLPGYRELIESALTAGYGIVSLGELWNRIGAGDLSSEQRWLVLRHDVDTDPATAAAMFAIDRDLGIRSSYFFRLSTVDLDLMAAVAQAGSEASYHYEELSTVAKQRGLRDRASAMAHLPEARDRFADNIWRLRNRTGLPMGVVAAHGDFVNRKLGVANTEVLADPVIRRELAIDLDAYDDDLLRVLPSRFTDIGYPRYWDPADPREAVAARAPILSVLTHPRHWRVARWTNAVDDVRRVAEGLRYDLAPRRTPRSSADRLP